MACWLAYGDTGTLQKSMRLPVEIPQRTAVPFKKRHLCHAAPKAVPQTLELGGPFEALRSLV